MERLVELNKAVEELDRAIDKLCQRFGYDNVELTGYQNIDEGEDIINREVIITICRKNGITVQLVGWINLDRRDGQTWGDFTLTIPELDLILLGGENNDYRIIRMDFDGENWSDFEVDVL